MARVTRGCDEGNAHVTGHVILLSKVLVVSAVCPRETRVKHAMAKRKRTTRMVIFEPEDQIKLLAWLDYTLKFKIPFESTVTDQLMILCAKEFTLPKVNKKLYSLWQRLGSNDAQDRREIFDKGSACLDGLDETERDLIRERLAMLEDLAIHRHASERRYLRSTTRSEIPVSENLDSLEIAPTPKTDRKTKNGYKQDKLCTPKQEAAGPKPPEERGPAGTKKRNTETVCISCLLQRTISNIQSFAQQPKAVASHKERGSSEDLDAKGTIQPIRKVIRDSEEEDNSAVDNERNIGKEGVKPREAETKLQGHFSESQPDLRRLVKSIRRKNRALKKTLTEVQQKQLPRLESEKKDLQDQIDCLELALKQGSKGEDVIFRQERSIWELEKKLRNRVSLGTFTKHCETHSSRPRATWLEQEMGDIREGVKHILYWYDYDQPLIVPKLESHSELKRLLYEALNFDPEKVAGRESLTWSLSEIEPQAVVRAITAFALRDWIFESDFPNFKENISPVLTKYREHLGSQGIGPRNLLRLFNIVRLTHCIDGLIALSNLDSAAYNTLIRDTQFRAHTIHRRAEKLAKKLSRTLAPFFPASHLESVQAAPISGGQDEDKSKYRRTHLVEIFETSLKLKADSILNLERYEMVFPPPGTIFDKTTMEAETMSGGRIDTLERRPRQVKLCLHPSILAYTSEKAEEVGLLPMITVDSRNFIRMEKSQRGCATVVTKAVVILEA